MKTINSALGLAITFITLLYGCSGNIKRGNSEISREDELTGYFAGMQDVCMDSLEPLCGVVPDSTFHVEIDVKDLYLVDAATLFKAERVVKLETNRECLIGEIDKIVYADSIFFILDRDLAKAVYAFDNNGRFISQIGYAGRGPEEYIEPTDIFYDEEHKYLTVWDQFSHRFVAYTADGQFIDDMSIPLRFLHCEKVPADSTLWCSIMWNNSIQQLNGYQLAKIDYKANSVINKSDYNPLVMNYIPEGSNMRVLNNKVFYHPQFNDTIFSLFRNTIAPEYIFSFKNVENLPDNLMEICNGDYEKFMELYREAGVGYFENDFLVTEKNLYAEISVANQVITIRYNKETGKVSVMLPQIYAAPFSENLTQVCNLVWGTLNSTTYSEGVLISPINCSLLKYLSSEEREYFELLDIDEDDNPVIFFFKEI